MIRNIDMNEVSDGRLYSSGDLVKCGCSDCTGCTDCCCYGMRDTIILDPYDIYMLEKGLNTTFTKLLSDEVIKLNVVDGVLLPNLKMQKDTNGCIFLNEDDRCSIHDYRPGICRLFPLGRIYNDTGFDYFLQVNECPHPNKTKVKIKKWLSIPNLPKYEEFIFTWHSLLKEFGTQIEKADVNCASKLTVDFLKLYYETPYDTGRDFYEQFYDRLNAVLCTN